MDFSVRLGLVFAAAVLLSTATVAETLEMRVLRVATGLDPGDGSGRPASDYYFDGGATDGLVPGMRLPVFRALRVRDALRDRVHDVRMPVGEMEVLEVFETTALARVSSIDPAAETPLFAPRAVMIGDYVLPAIRSTGGREGDGPPRVDDPGASSASPQTFVPGFPSADAWYPLPPPVLFGLNSSDLDLDAQYGLEGVALALAENAERLISLEGRTCNLGEASYNRVLSLRRARTVAAFLQSRGVAAERVSVTAFGEDSPVASNTTEADRRHNRRVDLRVGTSVPTQEPEIPRFTP